MTAADRSQTVVHLVRHGEVHNPMGVLYGRSPGYHLSERGRAMAERVAGHFAGHDIALVVSSPLERAVETATPIAAAHQLDILIDSRLVEAGNHFEGKTFGTGNGSLRYPGNWKLVRNPFTPSWGEPYVQIAARMSEAIAAARQHRPGRELIIVTHQLPVWVTRCHLEGRRLWHDPRRRQCDLASVTTLTYDGDRLRSIGYAEPARDLAAGANKVPGA